MVIFTNLTSFQVQKPRQISCLGLDDAIGHLQKNEIIKGYSEI